MDPGNELRTPDGDVRGTHTIGLRRSLPIVSAHPLQATTSCRQRPLKILRPGLSADNDLVQGDEALQTILVYDRD
jgi:hypothetical protein